MSLAIAFKGPEGIVLAAEKEGVLAYVKDHDGADYLEIADACAMELEQAVNLCQQLVAEGRLNAWPAVDEEDGAQ